MNIQNCINCEKKKLRAKKIAALKKWLKNGYENDK